MNKRELLIQKYITDLESKFNEEVDVDLLTKITIGLGPSIYNADSSTVSSSDQKEINTVKTKFLMGKLGLEDGDALDDAIDNLMVAYGKTNRSKYRAVVYYLLTKHFGKEAVYE